MSELPVETWHWFAFCGLVAVLLVLDLFVFHRHDHRPTLRESTLFTIFWISLGLLFNGLIWWWGIASGCGSQPGMEFLAGYLTEKALSMDNIFVFVVIFRFFAIPMMYQYRVLFWGILGAIIMRGVFVLAGAALVKEFAWLLVILGGFLLYTAWKLARHTGEDVHPEKNIVLRTARRFFHVTEGDHHQHGNQFFVRENGLLCVTPMFLVLLVVESTDVVFAVDSVPAIFGLTTDAFIIFTSNIFAILGLRALYFLLADVIDRFCYLHYGLAAVLGFVGAKMIVAYDWPKVGGIHIPIWISLVVIVSLLAIAIVASVVATSREENEPTDE